MSDELKNCPTPWCGGKHGEPYVFERRFDCIGVYCPGCCVSTDYHRSQEAAIEQWNHRPSSNEALLREARQFVQFAAEDVELMDDALITLARIDAVLNTVDER